MLDLEFWSAATAQIGVYTPLPVGGEGGEFRKKTSQFEKGGRGVTPLPTPAPTGGESGGEWEGSHRFLLFWTKILVF